MQNKWVKIIVQMKHGADSSQVLATLWGLCWKLPRTCHTGTLPCTKKNGTWTWSVPLKLCDVLTITTDKHPPKNTFNTNSREQTVSHWRKTYFMFFSNEEEQEFSEWFAPVLKVQVQAFPSKTHAWSPYDIIPEIYHKLWSPGGRRDLRTFSCAWRNTAM